tara:strand:+ start:540 stop:728 length:189 start_codon:yes stop_codon:yes gene_type:complete
MSLFIEGDFKHKKRRAEYSTSKREDPQGSNNKDVERYACKNEELCTMTLRFASDYQERAKKN